jgi:putative transposase
VARIARSSFPSYGVWQVTARGVEQRRVYLDRGDARWFMTQLWRALDKLDLRALVLCLMPNHYHFVAEGVREQLSKALHRVNGVYAADFNEKYGRSGHLWGDRFALWQIRDDEHLRETCRYVMANPVRAGLCERPSDWEWSWSRYPLGSD